MYKETLRKIIHQDWLSLSLLLGFLLVIALVSSIPLYTHGVLQQLMLKKIETMQEEENVYPGNYRISAEYDWLPPGERAEALTATEKEIRQQMLPGLLLPALTEKQEFSLGRYQGELKNSEENNSYTRSVELRLIKDLNDHIELVEGRLFSGKTEDNETLKEAMVTLSYAWSHEIKTGDRLTLKDSRKDPLFDVEIVGIFRYSDGRDLFWNEEITRYDSVLFLDYPSQAQELLFSTDSQLEEARWNFALDYREITTGLIPQMLNQWLWQEKNAALYQGNFTLELPLIPLMQEYLTSESDLRLSLWVLLSPVFLLLIFYIMMVSDMVVKQEANEISTLKSRGFSMGRIFWKYSFETLLLLATGLLIGPILGLAFSRFISSTTGFMQFERQTVPAITLNVQVYAYALLSCLLLFLFRMIPVLQVARKSIVELKREKSRHGTKPIWYRFYLDAVLLALSLYGLYRFSQQMKLWQASTESMLQGSMDPLLFLTSTIFMLGTGLLLLRFFPKLVAAIFHWGRDHWSPQMYSSLLYVERNHSESLMFMLFLMLAIATGLFSANTARTLNQNIEDQIYYKQGAEVMMVPRWSAHFEDDGSGTVSMADAMARTFALARGDAGLNYVEPDFELFRNLQSLKSAARVYIQKSGEAEIFGNRVAKVQIMGIDSFDFGHTAWFRSGLLDAHFYSYLNLLSHSPRAALVSESFKEYGVDLGDQIYIGWNDQSMVPLRVYGFVKYWPSFDPTATALSGKKSTLIVTNLDYLQSVFAKEPYQVWMRLAEGVSPEQLFQELEEKEISYQELKTVYKDLEEKKEDPLLRGLNGVLTQGFLLILVLCLVGFLLFRLISLHSRSLHFGIFRAMGLTEKQVLQSVLAEQWITLGSAIMLGILLGSLASHIFVPFLQIFFSFTEKSPQFRVTFSRADYLKIYAIILGLLGAGYTAVRWFLKRLNIGAALKLGED